MKGKMNRILSIVASLAIMTTIIPTSVVGADVKAKEEVVQRQGATEKVERRFVAYFTDWAYNNEQNMHYTADMMPWDKITHINYAFATVDATTNKIKVSNPEAATELEFPGQTSDFPYKGHFNVLNSYKKKYPKVKTLISVGGWAESQGFYSMMSTEAGRETFANSAIQFLRTYGFDGVDIDFEYPTNLDAGNPNDMDYAKPYRQEVYNNYCKMMKLLRQKIDEASATDGKEYLLTAAVTASAWVVSGMGEENYAKYLDYLNLMTYDFHGSWNGFVAHNSPLYSDPNDSEIKYWSLPYNYLSTDWAVKYYSGFMDPEDIVIGIPYYTRGWENVKPSTYPGGLYGTAWGEGKIPDAPGTGATGIDNIWHDKLPDGTEEPGGSNPLWHVLNLLDNKSLGYERYWDDVSKVPYIWNENKKVWLSHEDEQSMNEKVDYVIKNNLGGVMVWEMDGDFGPNPNYVPGSTKVNEGKYGVGETLTTIAYEKFKAAGPLLVEDKVNTLPEVNFDIELVNDYDHPNNSFQVNLINNTGKVIAKPAKIEFDLPNSIYFRTDPWSSGAEIKVEDRGLYKHFTVTVGDWGVNLGTGKTKIMEGDMILRPIGGPKNLRLNGNSSKAEWDRIRAEKPSLLAAAVSSSTTDSRDGNYSVMVSVPANSKGTSIDLYENNKVIKTESIDAQAKQFTYQMNNKPNGIYEYKVVIKNDSKEIQSSIVSIYVGPELILKPAVVSSTSAVSDTGEYKITVSIPANSNGTIVDIYEGTNKIASESINNTAKELSYEIKGKQNGVYQYKAIIRRGDKFIESNIKSVKVAIKMDYKKYDPTYGYTKGDLVAYEGKIYESQGWWVVGITPGTNASVWKYICDEPLTDIIDLATIATKYNFKDGEANFDPSCDLNNDGLIDLFDLVIASKKIAKLVYTSLKY